MMRVVYRSSSRMWISMMNVAVRRYSQEELLLYAILYRTVQDLSMPKKTKIFREAASWVLSKNKSPFSFLWIIETLDIGGKLLYAMRDLAYGNIEVSLQDRFLLLNYNRVMGRPDKARMPKRKATELSRLLG